MLLNTHKDIPVLLSGDWNCSVSLEPVNTNIDLLNMINLPNELHSNLLQNLCLEFELCDPFRVLYPKRTEFSYVPRDKNKTNRSRIDFFVVSKCAVAKVVECGIAETFQNKLFDHKAISLSFKKKKKSNSLPTISNQDMDNEFMDIVVRALFLECYIHQASATCD
jgi:exonuclease III